MDLTRHIITTALKCEHKAHQALNRQTKRPLTEAEKFRADEHRVLTAAAESLYADGRKVEASSLQQAA